MPKRSAELFAVDILVAIEKIDRYHSDFYDAQSFYYDDKSFDATMRELQIIGEATRHLIDADILDNEYRMIVNFRNLIVHEYFGIDADEIWDILHTSLPAFKKTIHHILLGLDRKTVISIISDTMEDYRGKSADYLGTLYDEIVIDSQNAHTFP